jgi:hypothetical protein
MNKKIKKALRTAATGVNEIVQPFEQFTNGCQMLVDEIPKAPDVASCTGHSYPCPNACYLWSPGQSS